MRNCAIATLLLCLACGTVACGPEAIASPDRLVYEGEYVADILPDRISIIGADGNERTVRVVWDTDTWQGMPLQKSVTISGRVEELNRRARVNVVVLSRTAALPQLTAKELAGNEATALMQRKLQEDKRVVNTTWSPDKKAVAFTLFEEGPLYIWSASKAEPTELLPVNFYHQLAWSADGGFLCTHIYPTLGEHAVRVIAYPSLEISPPIDIVGLTYWSPAENKLLLSHMTAILPTSGGFSAALTNLAEYDAVSKKLRVLLAADRETAYTAAGWTDADSVSSVRHRNYRQKDLTLNIK